MRKQEKFNEIFNECLDRILKGESVDQCLLKYPEHSKELEPLLRTASVARAISSIQPRPEYKVEAKRKFQAALIEMSVEQNERKADLSRGLQWRWKSAWATALVALAIVILGGGGIVAASSGSMPDSSFYSVKLATERLQLALTPGQVAKTKLSAEFAERRVEEIIYAAEKGDAQETEIAAVRLNAVLSDISNLVAGNDVNLADKSGENPSVMAAHSAESSKNAAPPLRTPLPPAPELTSAMPNQSIEQSAAGAGEPVAAAVPEDTPMGILSAPVVPQTDVSSEQSGIKENEPEDAENWHSPDSVKLNATKYEKMAQIIRESYEERKMKLEQALQNVSPTTRPAIQQAIEQSDLEYGQALKNLTEAERSQD